MLPPSAAICHGHVVIAESEPKGVKKRQQEVQGTRKGARRVVVRRELGDTRHAGGKRVLAWDGRGCGRGGRGKGLIKLKRCAYFDRDVDDAPRIFTPRRSATTQRRERLALQRAIRCKRDSAHDAPFNTKPGTKPTRGRIFKSWGLHCRIYGFFSLFFGQLF